MKALAADLFWVRSPVAHTPAHLVLGWDGTQAITCCLAVPRVGGEVISYDRARALQVHVCVACVASKNVAVAR